MFDRQKSESILSWTATDLTSLPAEEDDSFEFKSSRVGDKELGQKLARAASGFWNAGGGLFVAGVDGFGKPDDGISRTVGRQSRRDWADQIIAQVVPAGVYSLAMIEGDATTAGIVAGNVVLLAAFQQSLSGPHMAPDLSYYIRAGAHTVKASHFLVEAIRSRRAVNEPQIGIVLRVDPDNSYRSQICLLALTDAPALNVEVTFSLLPPMLARGKQTVSIFRRGAIDRNTPFILGHTFVNHNTKTWMAPAGEIVMKVKFSDLLGRRYEFDRELDSVAELGAPPPDIVPLERMAQSLADIREWVEVAAKKLPSQPVAPARTPSR